MKDDEDVRSGAVDAEKRVRKSRVSKSAYVDSMSASP
jgi:hypothetical protein